MAGKFVHIDKKMSPPKVESLSCPKCGGTITLRAKGYTKTLVCQFCQTILDVSQSGLNISGFTKLNDVVDPLIPLGTRGKLHGTLWEVIGFMQRRGTFSPFLHQQKPPFSLTAGGLLTAALDIISDDDDSDDVYVPPPPFVWDEYLLFNPYKGFRWLSECKGHWNYIVTLHDVPENYPNHILRYLNVNYRYYESYEAKVLYVAGEFYWQVKSGDTAEISDYLNKPGILTLEESTEKTSALTRPQTQSTALYIGGHETEAGTYLRPSPLSEDVSPLVNKEQMWSLAEYIEPEEVISAFKLTGDFPSKIGIAFNQPLPDKETYTSILKTSGIGIAALLVFYTIFGLFIEPKIILNAKFVVPSTESHVIGLENAMDYVSPPFNIDKHSGVLNLVLQAPVNQSWMEVEASLINDTTGESIEIQKGLEYYSGYDYDGSWTEGKDRDEMTFSKPEAGQYHLSFKITTNHTGSLPVKMQLIEGVNSFSNFLFSLLLVAVPAILVLLYMFLFEARRET